MAAIAQDIGTDHARPLLDARVIEPLIEVYACVHVVKGVVT